MQIHVTMLNNLYVVVVIVVVAIKYIYILKITIYGFSCQCIIFTGLAVEFAIQILTIADPKSLKFCF